MWSVENAQGCKKPGNFVFLMPKVPLPTDTPYLGKDPKSVIYINFIRLEVFSSS
jgi:hypothetical protein